MKNKILKSSRIIIIFSFLINLIAFSEQYLASSKNSQLIYFCYFMFFALLLISLILFTIISTTVILIKKITKKEITYYLYLGPISLIIFMLFFFSFWRIASILPEHLASGSDLMKFDSVVWKSKTSSDYENGLSKREMMLKDLVENILPGKTKPEIEYLLGTSLDTPYFQKVDKDLIYYMGPERDNFISIDSEWLLIWLYKNGKFKKYRIYND